MKSNIIKRSVVIAGHRTSVSLEDEFWNVLKEIARSRQCTVSDLVFSIDKDREHGNLSSAIRLFVLAACRGEIACTIGHVALASMTLADLAEDKPV